MDKTIITAISVALPLLIIFWMSISYTRLIRTLEAPLRKKLYSVIWGFFGVSILSFLITLAMKFGIYSSLFLANILLPWITILLLFWLGFALLPKAIEKTPHEDPLILHTSYRLKTWMSIYGITSLISTGVMQSIMRGWVPYNQTLTTIAGILSLVGFISMIFAWHQAYKVRRLFYFDRLEVEEEKSEEV
jgi:hypothetical protein